MKKILAMAVALSAICGRAGEDSWAHALVPDAIGTRSTYYWLQDSSRPENDTFLGSIDGQDAKQDAWPYKIFGQWNVGKYAYLEATWDEVKAVEQSGHGSGDSDGTLKMSGPILTVNGRLPNDTRFTPFAGIGLAVWHGYFDHADWHHYGFDSVADWESVGSPTQPRHGKVRHIDVEDDVGFVATMGVDIALGHDWVLDVYGRYMDIGTEYHFTVDQPAGRSNDVRGTFPLDNLALGIGLARTF